MEDNRIIFNPMLALDEYYSQLNEEEKINGDDMFYDEVIKAELQLTSRTLGRTIKKRSSIL